MEVANLINIESDVNSEEVDFMSKKYHINNDKEADTFFEREISKRFNSDSLNYKLKLLNGKSVRYVNLDNAATTAPFLRILEEVTKELNEYGSVHRGAGEKSKISTEKYEEVRNTIRKFVNAPKEDYVVFVSNTTAGMNQLAYFFSLIKGKILVSDIEHSASLLPWVFHEGRRVNSDQISMKEVLKGETENLNKEILQEGNKRVITYRTTRDFSFDLKDVERIFKENYGKNDDEHIKVLVVTGASNVTGYKPPIEQLSKLAHKYGALIVVDACQLLQHEKIDMKKGDLDFVVFSGHKMYAPFGSGAIIGKKIILDAFWPYMMGGGNFPYISSEGEVLRFKKEQAHDPGTPNYVGARAIHFAIKEFGEIGLQNIKNYEHYIVKRAFEELEKLEGVTLYITKTKSGEIDRSLITFNLRGFYPKLVSEILNKEYGIGTRAGSYCVYEFSRRIHEITHEQDKIITREVKSGKTANIPGSVRASFSFTNNLEDANRLVLAIREIIKKGPAGYKNKYKNNELSGDWTYGKE